MMKEESGVGEPVELSNLEAFVSKEKSAMAFKTPCKRNPPTKVEPEATKKIQKGCGR